MARQHGFSVSEWRVMATLAGGDADQHRPARAGRGDEAADRDAHARPHGQKGHVERLPHDSDRRITLVRITDAGERTVKHLMELAREHEHRVLEPFGLESAEVLKDTLRRMIELHADRRRPTAVEDDEADDDRRLHACSGAARSRKSSTACAKASGNWSGSGTMPPSMSTMRACGRCAASSAACGAAKGSSGARSSSIGWVTRPMRSSMR